MLIKASNYAFCFHKANDDVTSHQMDVVKVNDDGLQSLIEKVVNDELQKLAHEKSQTIAVKVIKQSSEPLLNVVSTKDETLPETTESFDESTTEQIDFNDTTESTNLGTEIILPTVPPTVAPAVDELQHVTKEAETTTNTLPDGYDDDNDDHVSDSLLSAVGDLLSSLLGLDSAIGKVKTESVDSNNEKEVTTESQLFLSTEANEMAESTEKIDEETTTTPASNEGDEESSETVPAEISDVTSSSSQDKLSNEVDVKIENLAIAQTSFATENTPEQVNETVRDKVAPEMLEVIAATTDNQPDSIEYRINQVMDLVKGTEGRLALQSMGIVVDSTLVDKEMKHDVSDLAQIVYGTLKEAQSNFGLNEDTEKTSNSFSPSFHEDLIKNFEVEINDALVNKHHFDHENYEPNTAKAALRYKHQDLDDF